MSKRADGVEVAYPLFQAEGGGSIPTSALALRIEEIPMRLAQDLNRKWHSMLPRTDLGNLLCGNTSVAYGAALGGNWVAVAIWSQPIIRAMCDGKTIELRRLAICKGAPRFTASRMIAIMRRLLKRKWKHLNRAVSYLAVDVHNGCIYRASGWKAVGEIVDARPQRFSKVNPNTRATGPLQTTSRKQRWEIGV